MKILSRALWIVFCLCVWIPMQAQTTAPLSVPIRPGTAVISDLKGEVFVTLPGGTSAAAAQKGQMLYENSTVECKKGMALLALSDGSQVLMKSNTRVILRVPEEAKGNFLEQLIGKITATVKKRATGDPPFKMGTPSAVITVRGTKFMVEVSKQQQTFVQVYEGVVQVESLAALGRPVYLQGGYITQVPPHQPPNPPRRLMDEVQRGEDAAGFNSSRNATDSKGRSTTSQPTGGGSEIDH